jgi:sugar phosphate isomerase/epimerase
MPMTLSLNVNPLVNRFADPESLIDAIAGEIGIGQVQLTHEFINPAWAAKTVRRLSAAMEAACARCGVKITSLMTGPYGRLNHFGHPDSEVREFYLEWFKGLVDIAAALNCPAVGAQFAILTYRDYDDLARRTAIMDAALDCWRRLAEHAAKRGLNYLFWEPMSVGRELGHTLAETEALQDRLDKAGLAIPLHAMIDIDHGDVSSPNPSDTDPYAWASRFAARSPIIHMPNTITMGGSFPKSSSRRSGTAAAATMNCAWNSPFANASRRIETSSP